MTNVHEVLERARVAGSDCPEKDAALPFAERRGSAG
jgi:hypothetical protein